MPFRSKAQMRKFFADRKLRKYAQKWAAATPSIEALPEHVKPAKKKRARAKDAGTMVRLRAKTHSINSKGRKQAQLRMVNRVARKNRK